MSDTLVKVENVSKKFCRSLKKSLWYGMQDLGNELLGRRHGGDGELRPDEFWAVRDVSFELKRGECLGLIGRNGAGKTTLLRMLNGLIKPDAGRIEMQGRVGALIALGAGFNPILTGRENIYVNASVLGLSKKEIDVKFEEIVEFAELGEFIDAPVQSYSSGMAVRLGFAVAALINPDIFLIDEVLAVGDIRFRSRCYDLINSIRPSTAIVIISHQRTDLIRVSTSGMFIDKGIRNYYGELADALRIYEEKCREDFSPLSISCDSVEVVNLEIYPKCISWGDSVKLLVELQVNDLLVDVSYRISIVDESDYCVAEWRSSNYFHPLTLDIGRTRLERYIGPINISSGFYKVNFILSTNNKEYLCLKYGFTDLSVYGSVLGLSRYQI